MNKPEAPESSITLSNEGEEHDWLLREWSYSHGTQIQACSKCGIVRRADDGNKPCRGKVKVGVR